jgi:hypothetical protein
MDYNYARAPAAVGMSNMTKAIDATAQITMEDHQLTDLRSDVRMGETMTPKLPPRLQAQADAVFSRKRRGGGVRLPVQEAVIRGQINAGSLRPGVRGQQDVVADLHRAQIKPPIKIINQQ